MTEQQKLNEIIAMMTFLQIHIQNYIDQSFTDLTFNLETVIKEFLNVFEKENEKYENINTMQHNYPAIDLVNKTKDTAIQVTSNADLRKVKKTVAMYQKHKISYSNLIVIGFVKATKASLSNVTVHSIDYLIRLARYGTSEQKDKVCEILQRQIPWNSLHPLDDKMCFDVVFDVINRSAVRDNTKCEGHFDKMVDGLFEVKEIITTGKIKGKSIRAKALIEYTDSVKRHLSEIEFKVSNIIQICNSNKNRRNSNYLDFKRQEIDRIDELKEEIIVKTNSLADELQLNKKIIGSKSW